MPPTCCAASTCCPSRLADPDSSRLQPLPRKAGDERRDMSICRLLLLSCATLLAGGCGISGDDPLASKTSRADAAAVAAATAVVGSASEFAISQLYQGTTAIAALSGDFGSYALRDVANGGPGIPAAQSLIITASTFTAVAGGTASGTATFTSDRLAPDSSTLPTGWWHLNVNFADQASAFTVTADDGTVANATSGSLDLYVRDGATTITSAGNWTQVIDAWTIARTATAPGLTISPGTPGARTTTITGIRHLSRTVSRVDNATTITRTETASIDGDTTALLAAVPSLAALWNVTAGPRLPDSNLPRTDRLFARWVQPTTLADASTATWTWDRLINWTIVQTKPRAAAAWASTTVTGSGASHYLARDAVREGVYTPSGIVNRWAMVVDLARSGRRL